MLSRQWPAAEALLLAQGKADDAIAMYKEMHRWAVVGTAAGQGEGSGPGRIHFTQPGQLLARRPPAAHNTPAFPAPELPGALPWPCLCRWEDAIRVADVARHPQAEALRRDQLQWLLETGQEGRAGAAKQAEGDSLAAISLYLRGGLPARAAQVRDGAGCGSIRQRALEVPGRC